MALRVPAALKIWSLRLYEIPFLAAVAAFAFWVRMGSYAPNVTASHVYYIGTDPYYHLRVVLATVANFPHALRYDPFTNFPIGTGTGQFGSLFDQGAAALAILLGKTDAHGVREVVAWYPALLGALCFIPFYFLARALLGRIGALFATTALAFIPGEFLVRSLAGYSDHHIAEAIGLATSTLGAFVALEVAARRSHALSWPPDWKALAWPIGAVVLGALGVVLYFLVWSPAILVVGIFGIFLAVTFAYEHVRGADTRYIAFGGGGTFLLAGLLLLPKAESAQLNFNTYSLIQPLACLLLGAGLVALHFLSVYSRRLRAPSGALPAGGLALGVLGFFSLKVFAPGLYGSLYWGMSWVTGIGVKREILTIAEAQPSSWSQLEGEYALLLYLFVVALVAMLVVVLWRRRRADLLLLILCAICFQAANTQVRFNYYLALVVALAFGWSAHLVADLTGLEKGLAAWWREGTVEEKVAPVSKGSRGRKVRQVEAEVRPRAWQFFAVAAVGLILLPSLVIPEKAPDGRRATSCGVNVAIYPVWVLPKCFGGPDEDLEVWVDSLDWLRKHTPTFGLDVVNEVARPPPGQTFAYPAGAYGILSWWDYGHWIEVEGERPPVANPFQQAAPFASCFFTATSESRADAMLTAWSTGTFDRGSANLPCDRVPLGTASEHDAKPVRYVMIDDEMAAGKYYAITVWAKYNEYAKQEDVRDFTLRDTGQKFSLNYVGKGYYDTMLSRLYNDDAVNLQHYRLVAESRKFAVIGSVVHVDESGQAQVTRFNDVINRQDPRARGSDVNDLALPRDQLISTGRTGEYAYDAKFTATVKTFEHVPGAKLTGVVAPNARLSIQIPLTSATTGRNFTWQSSANADASGAFTLVVPYATAQYVPASEKGTDYDVTARGPARLQLSDGKIATVDVPDRAVLDGTSVPVAFA